MRKPWLVLFLLLGLACRSDKTVPEPGAALLNVKCEAGAPTPDELRVWVYDDTGRLWDGVRVPADGALAAASPSNLGTILIAPGQLQGTLRVHVRGFVGGARALDGVLTVAALASGDRTFDLLLSAGLPPDADVDDVPDAIDDCPGVANPAQGGCPSPGLPDAAVTSDGADDVDRDLVPGVEDAVLADEAGGDSESSADLGTDLGDVPMGVGDGADAAQAPVETGKDSVDTRLVADLARLDGGDTAAEVRRDLGAEVLVVPDGGPDGGADVGRDAPGEAREAGAEVSCGEGGSCGQSQGAPCSTDGECASGVCADGVCCTNACTGPCRSCNQPSANGVCQGYPSGSDPELECTGGSTCNGVGACGPVPPPNLANGQLCTTPGQCQSGFCKDGVCCNAACTEPCAACGTGVCLPVKRTTDFPECTDTKTCNQKGECV